MNAVQLRQYIVIPALKAIEHHSLAAENLIMGTAAVESRFEYVHQVGGGPALGLFQMEPDTYDDIWANYIQYRDELAQRIRNAIMYNGGIPSSQRLMWDLRFATIMCRVHYMRVPAQLPPADNPTKLAEYWKKYYNTEKGAGTVEKFLETYALAG